MLIFTNNDKFRINIGNNNSLTTLPIEKCDISIRNNNRLYDNLGIPIKYKNKDLIWNANSHTINLMNTNLYLSVNENGEINEVMNENKDFSNFEKFKYKIFRMLIMSCHGHSIGFSRFGDLSYHEAISFEFYIDNDTLSYIENETIKNVKYMKFKLKYNISNNTICIDNDKKDLLSVNQSGYIYLSTINSNEAQYLPFLNIYCIAKSEFVNTFSNSLEQYQNLLNIEEKSYQISKKINQWIINYVDYNICNSNINYVEKYIKTCIDIHEKQANLTHCIVKLSFNVGASRVNVIHSIPEKYKKQFQATDKFITIIIRKSQEYEPAIMNENDSFTDKEIFKYSMKINYVVYDLHGSHPYGVGKYTKICINLHQEQANLTNCVVCCSFNVGVGKHSQYIGLPALRGSVINSIPQEYKKELKQTKYLIILMIRPNNKNYSILIN